MKLESDSLAQDYKISVDRAKRPLHPMEIYSLPKSKTVIAACVDTSNWTVSSNGLPQKFSYYLNNSFATDCASSSSGEDYHKKLAHASLCLNKAARTHYHWLIQCLTSIHWAYLTRRTDCPILLPQSLTSSQQRWLYLCNLPVDDGKLFFKCPPDVRIFVEDLYVPEQLLYHLSAVRPSPVALLSLKSQILSAREVRLCDMEAAHGHASGLLYISRRLSRRGIENEECLEQLLLERGFSIVFAEKLSQEAQAHLFSSAKIIIAPHGAGLANILFAPPDCRILEISPSANISSCFANLWSTLHPLTQYTYYLCDVSNSDKDKPPHIQRMAINANRFIHYLDSEIL